MNNGYRLLIFDWDGTLMDSVSHIVDSFQKAIVDLALEARSDEAIRNIIGLGLTEAIDRLYPGRDAAFHEQLVECYRHHYLPAGPSPTELFPGAETTLRALHAEGYVLAVATGKGRRGLDKVLVETGLGELFVTTRCADESRSKPHPQMLHEIMAETGIGAEYTVMIGDTEFDMEMARNAGVTGLGVSYGVHSCTRLARHEISGCLDSIAELGGWLDNGVSLTQGAA